jgi:hypothetical protein
VGDNSNIKVNHLGENKMKFTPELSLNQLICVEQALEDRIERCETRLTKCIELGVTNAATEWQERINTAKAVLKVIKHT